MSKREFIFGGDTPWSHEQLQNKRRIADALMARKTPSRNVGEGLSAIGEALAARGINRRADRRVAELRGESDQKRQNILDGGSSAPQPIRHQPGLTIRSDEGDPRRGMMPNGAGTLGEILTATLNMLRQFEGFRETPYWDVNALRVGYGSSTITRPDGTVVPVRKGMRVTREDAERDLLRRVNDEFMPAARRAVGEDAFTALSPKQQAALTSLSYNYGAGAWNDDLSGVVEAVRSGDQGAVVQAIRALGSHNGGINASRRNKEATTFMGGDM
ncbi:MAG: hypothetical protein AAF982_03860 [Pseudomonadota bacterium]